MAKEVREKNVNGVKPNTSLGKTFDKKKNYYAAVKQLLLLSESVASSSRK